MRNLKHKVDAYFDLEHDTEGQLIYYGMIGAFLFVMIGGTIGNIIS